MAEVTSVENLSNFHPAKEAPDVKCRVGIDVGGTFTDCLVAKEGKGVAIFKLPSTPPDFERGVTGVLTLAAENNGLGLEAFLSEVESIVHGTTVATNALVEGKVGRVGLICNEGHPDILTLREAPRKETFEWRLDYPEPFVPRNLTREVRGRIDFEGNEIDALSETDVRDAVVHFRRMGVETVAVCFLWSIVNGAHERRVREIIGKAWPDVPITLSHELNPIPREYRRTIATAINAALHPVVSDYVSVLQTSLRDAGYDGELLMANCVGGMMPTQAIVEKPVFSVMSGPTLAPIAAKHLTPEPDIVVIDMGGTTFDVSAIRGGQLIVSPEAMITRSDMLGIPKVDVRSVGAGGGSIAWVDVAGLLKVGPQSAGARPGPACYGAGGTEPTVTDANLVLGVIDADFFLGGRIALDREAAERAVGRIAARLGVELLEAAHAVYATSNHTMIAAIEDITVKDGISPRDSYLVAGGGATPCHIAHMAEVLGIKRFMVPKYSAGLSAYGGLVSDLVFESASTLYCDANHFDADAINALLDRLRRSGMEFLARAGVEAGDRSFEYVYSARYEYQSWEIDVPFSMNDGVLVPADLPRLVADFHAMHERIYTIKDPQETVEFTTWKVRAVGINRDAVEARGTRLAPQSSPLEPKSRRPVYMHQLGGLRELPVYDGSRIGANARIEGPALIEEATTTLMLLPDMRVETDVHGNYLVDVK